MNKSTKYSNAILKLNRGVHAQLNLHQFFRAFSLSLILPNYRKCMGKLRFSKN